MYNLTHHVFCEKIEHDELGKQIIIHPLSSFMLKFVPGQFSFCLSVGISGIDPNAQNNLGIVLRAPDGKEIMNNDMPFQKPDDTTIGNSIILGLDVRNMVFETIGDYDMVLSINEETVGNLKIKVDQER